MQFHAQKLLTRAALVLAVSGAMTLPAVALPKGETLISAANYISRSDVDVTGRLVDIVNNVAIVELPNGDVRYVQLTHTENIVYSKYLGSEIGLITKGPHVVRIVGLISEPTIVDTGWQAPTPSNYTSQRRIEVQRSSTAAVQSRPVAAPAQARPVRALW